MKLTLDWYCFSGGGTDGETCPQGESGWTQTHKHGGLGRFAQPQVLQPVLLVLALLREPFHPGLGQRGARLGSQAAQQAHDPAPARGLRGAEGMEGSHNQPALPCTSASVSEGSPAGSCARPLPRVTSGFGKLRLGPAQRRGLGGWVWLRAPGRSWGWKRPVLPGCWSASSSERKTKTKTNENPKTKPFCNRSRSPFAQAGASQHLLFPGALSRPSCV